MSRAGQKTQMIATALLSLPGVCRQYGKCCLDEVQSKARMQLARMPCHASHSGRNCWTIWNHQAGARAVAIKVRPLASPVQLRRSL